MAFTLEEIRNEALALSNLEQVQLASSKESVLETEGRSVRGVLPQCRSTPAVAK
jgi:hypothetical protein